MKTFITHYSPLKERKTFQVEQLKKFNIDYNFIEIFNKEDLTEVELNKFDKSKLNLAEISLSLKHHYIYQLISDHYEYALILEDDSVLDSNFENLLNRCLKELPNEWDCIFIGGCCNLHIESIPEKILYYQKEGWSRGTGAYLIHNKCTKKLLEELKTNHQKIYWPIDWWLKDIFPKYHMKIYWTEPVLVHQGSESGLFKSSIR